MYIVSLMAFAVCFLTIFGMVANTSNQTFNRNNGILNSEIQVMNNSDQFTRNRGTNYSNNSNMVIGGGG